MNQPPNITTTIANFVRRKCADKYAGVIQPAILEFVLHQFFLIEFSKCGDTKEAATRTGEIVFEQMLNPIDRKLAEVFAGEVVKRCGV